MRRNSHEEEEIRWGAVGGGETRIHSAMKARGGSSKEDSSL